MKRVVIVVGTRPEAIKMAPVVRAVAAAPGLEPLLVSTGQHTDLLRSALAVFELTPNHELGVMVEGQTLAGTAARILDRFAPLLTDIKPAAVLVQGDTTTALAAGLAAYYAEVPVGHVEAGLRTYDHFNPFPEEGNRQLVDRLCRWCFAPTEASRQNLLAERINPARVLVTGNTGVDAFLWAVEKAGPPPASDPYVLLTLHRRESFGSPLREVLGGVLDFLAAEPLARVVWPVHPNPAVGAASDALVGGHPRVERLPPQDYLPFTRLMRGSRVILSDSGGVQEEAPSLGIRVLVVRESTERPEAVETGWNRLVGRTRAGVAEALLRAWAEPSYSGPIPSPNPFGDGQAADRIATALAEKLA